MARRNGMVAVLELVLNGGGIDGILENKIERVLHMMEAEGILSKTELDRKFEKEVYPRYKALINAIAKKWTQKKNQYLQTEDLEAILVEKLYDLWTQSIEDGWSPDNYKEDKFGSLFRTSAENKIRDYIRHLKSHTQNVMDPTTGLPHQSLDTPAFGDDSATASSLKDVVADVSAQDFEDAVVTKDSVTGMYKAIMGKLSDPTAKLVLQNMMKPNKEVEAYLKMSGKNYTTPTISDLARVLHMPEYPINTGNSRTDKVNFNYRYEKLKKAQDAVRIATAELLSDPKFVDAHNLDVRQTGSKQLKKALA